MASPISAAVARLMANHQKVVETGSREDIEAVQQAGRKLVSLAEDGKFRQATVDQALPALAKLLSDGSMPVGRFLAAWVLGLLAHNDTLKAPIADTMVPGLLELALTTPFAIHRMQAVSVICTLACDRGLQDPSRPSAHNRALSLAALPALVEVMQGADDEPSRVQAARAIANLSSDESRKPLAYDHLEPIASTAMPALVTLMQDAASPDGRSEAVRALDGLARSDDLRQLVACAALPALVSLLHDGDPSVSEGRRLAATALSRLAQKEDLRELISRRALQGLTNLLQDAGNPQGRIAAAAALANLACNPDVKEAIADAAMPGLVSLLNNTALPEGQQKAAIALLNLATDSDHLKGPIAEATLPALVSMLQGAAQSDGRCEAALLLARLATKPELRQPIALAAMPALLSLTNMPPSERQLQTKCAISILARCAGIKTPASDAAEEAMISFIQGDYDQFTGQIVDETLAELLEAASR